MLSVASSKHSWGKENAACISFNATAGCLNTMTESANVIIAQATDLIMHQQVSPTQAVMFVLVNSFFLSPA